MARRLLAEGIGTALLVAVVVGSGIAAQQLSPGQVGLRLLENSTTTVFGLAVLILVFGPVSGAHFNPAVSVVDWLLGRRTRTGLAGREVSAYIGVQVVGAIAGAVLANVMFGLAALEVSTKPRDGVGLWVGELVATAGLIAVIFTLARTGRAALSAAAVAGWIGAAYWFSSFHLLRQPRRHHRASVQRQLRRNHPQLRPRIHRCSALWPALAWSLLSAPMCPARRPLSSSPTPAPTATRRRPLADGTCRHHGEHDTSSAAQSLDPARRSR